MLLQRVALGADAMSAREALEIATLGGASVLGRDDLGSLVAGKRADFAVLGDDPMAVSPELLKDVPVLGTVSGGRIFLS